MKVSLKSSGLELEVDNVEKLDDVISFIEHLKDIERNEEASKRKFNLDTQQAIYELERKQPPKQKRRS